MNPWMNVFISLPCPHFRELTHKNIPFRYFIAKSFNHRPLGTQFPFLGVNDVINPLLKLEILSTYRQIYLYFLSSYLLFNSNVLQVMRLTPGERPPTHTPLGRSAPSRVTPAWLLPLGLRAPAAPSAVDAQIPARSPNPEGPSLPGAPPVRRLRVQTTNRGRLGIREERRRGLGFGATDLAQIPVRTCLLHGIGQIASLAACFHFCKMSSPTISRVSTVC